MQVLCRRQIHFKRLFRSDSLQEQMKVTQETKELEALNKKYTFDMKELGAEVVKVIESNYDKGLNFDGTKMKALSPVTIAGKRRLGSGTASKPLVRSGILRGSNFATVLGRNVVEVSVRDLVRGSVTNNQILDFAEKAGRVPFGLGSEVNKAIDNFIDKAIGR